MRRGAHRLDEVFTFGGRVPAAVGALIAAVVGASLFGALADRSGIPVRPMAVLIPDAVWMGQLWRLVTWVFIEADPLSLLFGGLMLFWFGRDLALAWGARRFVTTFFGMAVAAGIATALLSRAFPGMLLRQYFGLWPVLDALVIAWGMIFPERQILLYFALPVSGRALVYVTIGGTLLYSVFGGLQGFVPHLAAEGLMLLYARGYSLRGFWQRMRISSYERRARRRASHLKVVHRDGDRGDRPRWLN